MTGERAAKRLYLTHHDRYRVRYLDGSVVLCLWDDDGLRFRTGRGQQKRHIDMDKIAAVSAFVHEGRAVIRWTPWDHCYRAKHQPAEPRATWVHPYRRAA